LAEKLLASCDENNLMALKELGDRLEGKAAQSITHGGDENHLLQLIGKVILKQPLQLKYDPNGSSE